MVKEEYILTLITDSFLHSELKEPALPALGVQALYAVNYLPLLLVDYQGMSSLAMSAPPPDD